MAKKLKKMAKQIVDPNLEVVDEEHAFEIYYDDETNEAILVHHYRRNWGDEFDADVEHGYDIEQNTRLINNLMDILGQQKKSVINKAISVGLLIEKSPPSIEEGNPAQGHKIHECDIKKDVKDV